MRVIFHKAFPAMAVESPVIVYGCFRMKKGCAVLAAAIAFHFPDLSLV
jgi:hypothetical protein